MKTFLLACLVIPLLMGCNQTPKTFNKAPSFLIDDVSPVYGYGYNLRYSDGSEVETSHCNGNTCIMASIGPSFSYDLEEDKASFIKKKEGRYQISIDYVDKTVTYKAYLGYMFDYKTPLKESSVNWKQAYDYRFGELKELEMPIIDDKTCLPQLPPDTFAIDEYKEEAKFVAIVVDFSSPTYGSGVYGFLIENA